MRRWRSPCLPPAPAAAPGGKHGHAEALSVKAKNERRDVGRFRLRPQRFVFAEENAAGVKFLDYLLFSPTNAIKGKAPMVVYIPGNGEMGDVGRQFLGFWEGPPYNCNENGTFPR